MVVVRGTWDFEEIFRLLPVVHVNDSGQGTGAVVSITVLEVEVGFCWLLVKILAVEWMPMVVRLRVRNVPPVVPVFRLGHFFCCHLVYFHVNEWLRLVERTTSIDFKHAR